ncbi:hypothetical protein [uncultured Clostridium sp.]|uniref:hypothetical protein n=1 Tax=uncultured Clostridium sp. TaxID=59620 RepID=UPI002628B1C7|nr:hypothetical protein [uncultured Clostridium sp.]
MKMYYNSDSVNNCTENDSIFAHRDVSILHEERVGVKNAVMDTIIDDEIESLSKSEKKYWSLYRRGIKNKIIAEEMGISLVRCRQLKFRATRKIEKIAKKLKERLG